MYFILLLIAHVKINEKDVGKSAEKCYKYQKVVLLGYGQSGRVTRRGFPVRFDSSLLLIVIPFPERKGKKLV